MKRMFIKISFILLLALSLCALAFPSFSLAKSLDESLLIRGGISVDASEKLVICAQTEIYAVDYESKNVEIYDVKGAIKAEIANGKLVYLAEGRLVADDKEIASSVVDFSSSSSLIAYATANAVYLYDGQSSAKIADESAFAVAISEQSVYFGVKEDFSTSLYLYEDGSVERIYSHKKAFDKLVIANGVKGVSANTVYDFSAVSVVSPSAQSVAINGEDIYFLDGNRIYKNGEFFIGRGNLVSYPISSELYGKRLIINGENGLESFVESDKRWEKTFSYGDTVTAFDVSAENGNLYCASGNEVRLVDENGSALLYQYPQKVTSIKASYNSTVYASSDGIYENDTRISVLSGILALNKATNDLFIYSDGKFYDKGSNELFAFENAQDFEVGDDGVFYILSSGSVTVMKNADDEWKEIKKIDTTCEKCTDIAISRGSKDCGSIILTDNLGHTTTTLTEKATVNTEINVENAVVDEYCVRSTTASCQIYPDLSFENGIQMQPGTVICISYDLAENANLAYVCAIVNDELISGFVLKKYLSDAVEGSAPTHEKATTFYDNVIAYALPITNEAKPNAKLRTFSQSNQEVELLTKLSVYGVDWYKISADGIVGYVIAPSLQLGSYVPDVRPDTNATTTDSAQTYELVNGEYVATENVVLMIGTKVEVVGVFDSNTEYSQIKYYDESAGGTRTCYVKTTLLQYEYVTPEQKIALVVIVVLIITTALAVFIGIRAKRKRA